MRKWSFLELLKISTIFLQKMFDQGEKVLKKSDAELVAITPPETVPLLPGMEGTLCVCPNELYE